MMGVCGLQRFRMSENEKDEFARIIWNYLRMGYTPKRSDILFVLGSHDLRVAEYAASLFQDGFAPFVVVSGGVVENIGIYQTSYKMTRAYAFAYFVSRNRIDYSVSSGFKEFSGTTVVPSADDGGGDVVSSFFAEAGVTRCTTVPGVLA